MHYGNATQIWQVVDDTIGDSYALKTLSESRMNDRREAGFLKHEFTIGSKIDHPKIIRYVEFNIVKGQPYLVTDWFAGANLKRWIDQEGDKLRELLPKIVDEAADGLAYLHQLGWIHRDVKPTNFLADEQGGVRLIDLALAYRPKQGIMRFLPKKKEVLGTPSYMSPEQIRGKAVDERSDVYSFACMVHELIAGTPPHTGNSSNEVLSRHLKAKPPSLVASDKNVTPQFADLICRSLAKAPEDRPQSIQEFRIQMRHARIF